MLPPDQSRTIEQVIFFYSPFEKAFKKQTKQLKAWVKTSLSFKVFTTFELRNTIQQNTL